MAELPPKLMPLMDFSLSRARYYVSWGGRGSGKSWAFARSLLLQSCEDPLRILCAREIQRTLADSVHQLLVDQIEALDLTQAFTVTETAIANQATGAQFLFAGLRQQDAHKIKSYEGIDIVWVEEAQTVTKRSWDILIPTIRAQGSEIWVTFNPELDTDETYQRFVVHSPPNAVIMNVNWRDNPWFPDVLDQERRHLQRVDPEEYENTWDGKPRTAVAGAIYPNELARMLKERRIRPVPYDPRLNVHTIWDLGWNDATAILFVQALMSEVRIIDYEEDSFKRPDQWAQLIKDKDYQYGDHWLPHDGDNELLQAGGRSMKQILKPMLKATPRIIKQPKSVEDPIRAARLMFPRVYIDEDRCKRLVECLRRFKRRVPQTTGEPGAPVKDEYRHGADAFGGLAQIVDKLSDEATRPRPKVPEWGQAVPGVM